MRQTQKLNAPIFSEAFQAPPSGGFHVTTSWIFLRQLDIVAGDGVCAVRLQLDGDLGIADSQVGMMIGGLGEITDCVHQEQGVREAGRVVFAAQPAVADFPAGQRFQLFFQFAFRD